MPELRFAEEVTQNENICFEKLPEADEWRPGSEWRHVGTFLFRQEYSFYRIRNHLKNGFAIFRISGSGTENYLERIREKISAVHLLELKEILVLGCYVSASGYAAEELSLIVIRPEGMGNDDFMHAIDIISGKDTGDACIMRTAGQYKYEKLPEIFSRLRLPAGAEEEKYYIEGFRMPCNALHAMGLERMGSAPIWRTK
jgi:hypothetical protein